VKSSNTRTVHHLFIDRMRISVLSFESTYRMGRDCGISVLPSINDFLIYQSSSSSNSKATETKKVDDRPEIGGAELVESVIGPSSPYLWSVVSPCSCSAPSMPSILDN